MPNDEKNIDLDPIDFRGKNVKKNKKRFTAFCYSCIVRFDSLVIKSWHFFNKRSFSYTQISDFENFDLHIFLFLAFKNIFFFSGEAITFKATTMGVLSTLQHCLDLMSSESENWKKKLDKEKNRKETLASK